MSSGMPEPSEIPNLVEGFDLANEQEWRALAQAVLKGADFEQRLVGRTADGLRIEPVYPRAAASEPIVGVGRSAPWRIAQRVDHPEPDAAAGHALLDLEGGADMLAMVFATAPSSRGFGIVADDVEALDRSLGGVALDLVRVRCEGAGGGIVEAALLAALAKRRGHPAANLDVEFGLDPFGAAVHAGGFPDEWANVASRYAAAAQDLRQAGFEGPFFDCDARPVHEAGGSEAQELAYALASGVAWLRALTERGASLQDADRAIAFTFAIDADQFMGIAKLRAARRLWRRIQDEIGVPNEPMRIHAETAWRMMTRHDPAVNILRGTIACFTAAVGGADSISVIPFTATHGLPDRFARRVARNTQIVLSEESGLWRVADPAAGSGGYEALTEALAEAAWSAFQKLEAEGGMARALMAGRFQRDVAKQRAERQAAIALGRRPITGTSAFPNLNEGPIAVEPVAANVTRGRPSERRGSVSQAIEELVETLLSGGSRRDVTPPAAAIQQFPALPVMRDGEPFEDVRARADAFAARSGARPGVFLATLGALADHAPRTTWLTNFLATGGLEAVRVGDGFTSTADVGAAFAASGVSVAVICGSDADYALLADAAAQALKSAGATRVYVAGRPGSPETSLRASGVDGFVFAGCDSLAALVEIQAACGI
ncbi:MAG: methylmalonyl-CoA mutase family protein [Hyphomicrobiaceae bacterium]